MSSNFSVSMLACEERMKLPPSLFLGLYTLNLRWSAAGLIHARHL
jgi:hypothetical protein